MPKFLLLLLLCLPLTACGQSTMPQASKKVALGIDVLQQNGFEGLEGKKVGLVTNPTGVNSALASTADLLFEAEAVNLVALFGPEHGIRGDVPAGDKVADATDKKTGLPVYSLYGKSRRPSPEMLAGLEVLVYDIQDIGTRSYTYISTLALVMEVAAEEGIELIVLDRPNPLGGVRVEGNGVQPTFRSFVSALDIPYLHGMTVGELARWINEEELPAKGLKCALKVVPMQGWQRSMTWQDTGLAWVPSSPHIPEAQSAFFYPMTGMMGELQTYSEGVGYPLPFQLIGAEWVDADAFAKAMNAYDLAGLHFRPVHFKPYYGRNSGQMLHGVQIHILDVHQVASLMQVQFYALEALHRLYPEKDVFALAAEKKRIEMFDKVSGTDQLRLRFSQRYKVADIKPLLEDGVTDFLQKRTPYLLYTN